ncbi:sensor histidine kinase [Larkinella soli]|uniref:sensor histidine kinase n=1 Tax=Larkinella soli TaxID=1770527 RepID=UPI000FFCBAA1|nr:sensor histidine kinase [Larkinella soli]
MNTRTVRNRLGAVVSLLGLLLTQAYAQAPTLSFQHLTLRRGLASNYSTSIVQDDLGFIWIGTVNGLNRFDGLRCATFIRQPGNARSLSHRLVRTVFRAKNGAVWIGTQQGLNRFDPRDQGFDRFAFSALGPGCNFIRTITETPDGQLWLGTNGGLVLFNPATGLSRGITLPADTASSASANAIRFVLPVGSVHWIATQGGLFAYDRSTGRIQTYRHDPAVPTSLPDDYVSTLALDPHTGELLVGTRSGRLARMNRKTGQCRLMPLAVAQTISSLLFTRAGTLWVGVGGEGLFRYDPVRDRFLSYKNDENNPRTLGSNSVKYLFEDRAGVVWVGTDDAGVSWFNPTVEKMHSLFDDVGYRPVSSLGFDAAGLSLDRRNGLWVATRDGLARFDLSAQTYRLYRHHPEDPRSLSNNLLYTTLADRSGQVWAGHPTGLDRLDPATGHFDHLRCLPAPDHPTDYPPFDPARRDFVAGNQVFDVVEGPDGRIYIGTNEKLTVYDPRTRTFLHQFNDERIRSLPGKNYNTLHFDRQNNLWVGGLGPVFKISADLRLLAQYVHREDDPSGVPDEGVTDFEEDRFGRMWMSTDNGLACLDQKTGRFMVFTKKHGLPHSDISAIALTGDTLWVSTSNGLASTSIRRIQFTVFDEADGLPTAEFESGARIRDAGGRLYFGAMRGLIYLQPGNLKPNRFVPPVYLTSFRVNNREQLPEPRADPSGFTFDYTQNQFAFDMAALSYDNPSANRYAYRLENFEDRWNQVGSQPFGTYTNVPPGNYVLHVIAANNDGVWNRVGYRLPLTIRAPFWQTWWFRIPAFVLLIVSTVFIAQWRARRQAREQQEKSELRERIAASEMKALRSQMNPHFLYNSLNAIRLFVLQNDSDNADKYLVKFARLMRLILGNSRQEWVPLANEIEQLQLYLELEQLRFSHKFDFAIEVDPALRQDATSIPPMIIQPYIENAILHGISHKKERGMIRVGIRAADDHMECSVDDDGVGRQRARQLKGPSSSSHQSVGMVVTEERVQLIRQRSGKDAGVTIIDKVDAGGAPAGTTVLIRLPLVV